MNNQVTNYYFEYKVYQNILTAHLITITLAPPTEV